MSFSKWIGGGLGWAFGGPIGGIIGFTVGAMFDQMRGPSADPGGPRIRATRTTTGGDLAMSLVVLTAEPIKGAIDVTQRELEHVRRFFLQQFGPAQAGQLLVLLRDVLKREIPLNDVLGQIRNNMPHPVRLQLMHYLIGLANADGRIDRTEFQLIHRIAQGMGISDKDLGSLSAMFRTADPTASYAVLEIEKTVTDDEVKKAYRRMAMKYHPDKVAQLGDEVQKAANEKFKKVQEAYESIQRERGMK